MILKELYSEIGKLLYAVADIDGVITHKEKIALQDIVKKELVPLESQTDGFGTNTAYYSEFEFDFLDEEIADTESAFNSFLDFVEEHRESFDANAKQLCLNITNELAAAYRKTNKKEKILIDTLKEKLERVFKENETKKS